MEYSSIRTILVILFVLWSPASLWMLYDRGEVYCGIGVAMSALVLIAYCVRPRGVVGSIGAMIAGIGWANDTYIAMTSGPNDPVINVFGLVLYVGVALVVLQLIADRNDRRARSGKANGPA
ncbi:hypothetical protein WG915_03840 [Corynebacterium sp. H128]|uniref:hypothetical protein n=1 Tax=Corynebacterium sp. H128 TaxID=3133427 RepID=UPI0030ADE8D4